MARDVNINDFQKEVLDAVKDITSFTRSASHNAPTFNKKPSTEMRLARSARLKATAAKRPTIKASAARLPLTGAASKKMSIEPLAKVFFVVRQAHHEREKVNDSNSATVHPELVEG